MVAKIESPRLWRSHGPRCRAAEWSWGILVSESSSVSLMAGHLLPPTRAGPRTLAKLGYQVSAVVLVLSLAHSQSLEVKTSLSCHGRVWAGGVEWAGLRLGEGSSPDSHPSRGEHSLLREEGRKKGAQSRARVLVATLFSPIPPSWKSLVPGALQAAWRAAGPHRAVRVSVWNMLPNISWGATARKEEREEKR